MSLISLSFLDVYVSNQCLINKSPLFLPWWLVLKFLLKTCDITTIQKLLVYLLIGLESLKFSSISHLF
jgi:hypothetical protein